MLLCIMLKTKYKKRTRNNNNNNKKHEPKNKRWKLKWCRWCVDGISKEDFLSEILYGSQIFEVSKRKVGLNYSYLYKKKKIIMRYMHH